MSLDADAVRRQAEMLANRVKKTFRHLHRRFERRNVGAFRVYDWDIPEIRAVVDWYEGHVVVAEYARTQTEAVDDWLGTMARAVADALGVPDEKVHVRRRRTRPREGPRYERVARTGRRLQVREGPLSFWVNLDDYVDTGLFLDHRLTRARVGAESRGKAFLNLYGYTGSFTCFAAWGGARETTTVDTSRTYLSWAKDNLALNDLRGRNALVNEDARAFLREAARGRRRWDLCVLDPPSFSDRGDLDIQRDHPSLIREALAVLAPGGTLYFSTNHQRFSPRLSSIRARIDEITAETLDEDFRRQPHRTWLIRP